MVGLKLGPTGPSSAQVRPQVGPKWAPFQPNLRPRTAKFFDPNHLWLGQVLSIQFSGCGCLGIQENSYTGKPCKDAACGVLNDTVKVHHGDLRCHPQDFRKDFFSPISIEFLPGARARNKVVCLQQLMGYSCSGIVSDRPWPPTSCFIF